MKALKERILRDGKCFEGGILKVDNFINHQMDPILMKSMAVEFVRRFASTKINKVLTIEASGIAPAIMVGYLLELPVVFAKKKKPSTMENMLTTTVYSFTNPTKNNLLFDDTKPLYKTPQDSCTLYIARSSQYKTKIYAIIRPQTYEQKPT